MLFIISKFLKTSVSIKTNKKTDNRELDTNNIIFFLILKLIFFEKNNVVIKKTIINPNNKNTEFPK